jgi:pimeloyl-ACP methyl ester carboxylesterase
MFLIAGGPGQASSQAFDLAAYGSLWQSLFPGYTLVAFDPRGTGLSANLKCEALQGDWYSGPHQVAKCASQLGNKASFYSTADNVKDLDAVREALGVSRVALWGVSYGTEVALDYARAYPTRVARLLLDSVDSPARPDPLGTEALSSLPLKLKAFCKDVVCPSDYPDAVVRLANALAKKPLVGSVLQMNGSRRRVSLDAEDFLSEVSQTDLDSGLAAELPAAVSSTLRGDPEPLLRLTELLDQEEARTPLINGALFSTTRCDDGGFPWSSQTPIAQRESLLQKAVVGHSNADFGGLAAWSHDLGDAAMCLDWPAFDASQPVSGAYPNVPMLALSGGLDMRTPTAEARSVVAQFTQGHLLVVPSSGHAVLDSSLSTCVISAVRRWLDNKTVRQTCNQPRELQPVTLSPPAIRSTLATRQPATLLSVKTTIDEAEAMWLMIRSEGGSPAAVAGLYAGKLVATKTGPSLSEYSVSPGIELSGRMDIAYGFDGPLSVTGTLSILEKGTVAGSIVVRGGTLSGHLDGTPIAGTPLDAQDDQWSDRYAVEQPIVLKLPETWQSFLPRDGTLLNAWDPETRAELNVFPNGSVSSRQAYFQRTKRNAVTHYRAQDPGAAVESRIVSLPSGSALEVTATLRLRVGSHKKPSLIVNYNIVHDGVGYDFEYQTPLNQTSQQSDFTRSARTIRFT